MQYFEKKCHVENISRCFKFVFNVKEKKKERNSKLVVQWHFLWMECLAGHMGLDMALKKNKTKHWFTTSFMKQSIYGFSISNLLMYFAHEGIWAGKYIS